MVRLLVVVAALFFVGCASATREPPSDGRLPVFAGIPPLAYLVEQIGGEHVAVKALVEPGQDPHMFEPTPRQVSALGKATLFFKIDMPFERTILEKARGGDRRLVVVDTTQGIKKRPMDAACGESHADHPHGHEEAATEQHDPHVWLSPPLLKIMAENITAALCKADPAHEADFRRNLAALIARLDAVDNGIRRRLAPYKGRSFYVFHPGFAYFADAYGLKEQAIETEGRQPTPQQLRTLIEKARADGVKAVFVQPQYSPESAAAVAQAIGGKVETISGLSMDVVADIEDIAAKIEASFTPAKPRG